MATAPAPAGAVAAAAGRAGPPDDISALERTGTARIWGRRLPVVDPPARPLTTVGRPSAG